MAINNDMETPTPQTPKLEEQRTGVMTDPTGLMFSGKIKIYDPETGEVFVEQRSE